MSTIVVRVEQKFYELLKDVAAKRGEDVSSFTRRSLKVELAKLNYLSSADRRALGLPFLFEENPNKKRKPPEERAKP